MKKKPLLNALGASGYIVLVVFLMDVISKTQGSKPDTAFAPVLFLSVLTLSVSVMAFIFFYEPLQLIIDRKKKEALKLFTQTVGYFALITCLGLIMLFSGVL